MDQVCVSDSEAEKHFVLVRTQNHCSFFMRGLRKVEAWATEFNGYHVAFKTLAFAIIAVWICLGWILLAFLHRWAINGQHDKLSFSRQDISNYFSEFKGFSQCSIASADLYMSPPRDERGHYLRNSFCKGRSSLLKAMSSGGRRGFEAPYMPRDCHYRWFSAVEICFILERFDSIIFIGDTSLHTIYSGLNILLQEDLATGALDIRSVSADAVKECRCENQFIKESCISQWISKSHQLGGGDESLACKKTTHAFIEVTNLDLSKEMITDFKHLAPKAPLSEYKPVPIVYSLSPSTFSHEDARASLLQFLKLAEESKRKTPMLWIGPTAAGHVEIKGRKGNQEIWEFDHKMRQTAEENDIEVLGMWNMTVQASSWDGMRFGEKVAITQAMMIVNWLSRLESS